MIFSSSKHAFLKCCVVATVGTNHKCYACILQFTLFRHNIGFAVYTLFGVKLINLIMSLVYIY